LLGQYSARSWAGPPNLVVVPERAGTPRDLRGRLKASRPRQVVGVRAR
jgi:hypothetical protein